MSAVQQLSDDWNYDPHNHDRASWWDHHRALIAAMEPAKWPKRSSRAYQSSLTADEAEFIRTWYAQGKATQTEIAEAFDVSNRLVSELVNGVIYKGVGGPITHRGAGKWPPNRHTA